MCAQDGWADTQVRPYGQRTVCVGHALPLCGPPKDAPTDDTNHVGRTSRTRRIGNFWRFCPVSNVKFLLTKCKFHVIVNTELNEYRSARQAAARCPTQPTPRAEVSLFSRDGQDFSGESCYFCALLKSEEPTWMYPSPISSRGWPRAPSC